MTGKRSRPILFGVAVLCVVFLAACGDNGPSLHFVAVTPVSGTVFFSSPPPVSGVKGARIGANSVRKSAAVSPQDLASASCGSLKFTATAHFSNGSSIDESNSVTWSSSNGSVASVNQTGTAFGFGVGTTTIGATFNGVQAAPATLEVDALNGITMKPSMATVASGGSQSFQALGNFTLADGSSSQQDISSNATFGTMWSSSDTNLVTVDQNGNATSTGNGSGQVTIKATSCDFGTVGTALLTVGPPPVMLLITPTNPAIAAGTTVQLSALKRSDNTNVTGTLTWQSADTTVATMDPGNFGIALGISAGSSPTGTSVTITATEAGTGFTGTATLTVKPAAARYAYVGNLQGGSITSYTVSGGALTHLADTPATSGAQQVLLHPSGHFLYYIDGGRTLQAYDVASGDPSSGGGLLSPPGGLPGMPDTCSSVPLGDSIVGVIEPYGRFVYAVSLSGQCIFGFSINQATGALTLIPGFDASTGITDATNLAAPIWVMTDRAGKFLYVVNNTTPGSITEYSIDQTTGALTLLPTPTIAAGNGTSNAPFFGTTDVNGHLFVANLGSGTTDQTVSTYNIGSNGQLQSAGADVTIGDTTTPATALINVLTDPTGTFLYALDDNASGGTGQVFAYSYTVGSNGLTLTNGSTQPTEVAPTGMAIDPTGTLLAIDNNLGSNTSNPPPGSISVYTVTSGVPGTPTTVPTGFGPAFVTFYIALSGQ